MDRNLIPRTHFNHFFAGCRFLNFFGASPVPFDGVLVFQAVVLFLVKRGRLILCNTLHKMCRKVQLRNRAGQVMIAYPVATRAMLTALSA